MGDLDPFTILEDLEIRGRESRDRPPRAVGDEYLEVDDRHIDRLEEGALGRRRFLADDGGSRPEDGSQQGDQDDRRP
jgi:hypothetical protein